MNAAAFVEQQIDVIRNEIKGMAIAALSGGIDSTVAAVITRMAVGDRLTAVHIDTGLMRKNETDLLLKAVEGLDLKVKIVDASEMFFKALEGVADPEEKRKRIGAAFIEVFSREAGMVGAEYLVQGTIAPDWIESGGGVRDRIKSHHNVGGLPQELHLKLIEPLRDLYKDEVRDVAKYLGIGWVERQPFPGPGLAVRVLGPVDKEKIQIEREACAIVEEEIQKAHASGRIEELPWQYFSVLLPVRSVGVRGDVRSYGYTLVIRAVKSKDAMTARFSRLPHELLEDISTTITNRLPQITRVVYDITNKPPGTIEWE
ncbi:MAG: glutamine-hydrolyzing GMP synthase [Methanomassiliicoccales archaeon]